MGRPQESFVKSAPTAGGAHHVPSGEPEIGRSPRRAFSREGSARGSVGPAWRSPGCGAPRTQRPASSPRPPRERSAVTPMTLPPLSERPLIAVETTVVPFVDDGPGLPMTTLVEPRGMVKRRVGTSPGRVDQAAPGGPGGPAPPLVRSWRRRRGRLGSHPLPFAPRCVRGVSWLRAGYNLTISFF